MPAINNQARQTDRSAIKPMKWGTLVQEQEDKIDHRVSVAFVPREQFSTTQRCLETLIERTSEPYDLIVVDGGSPPDVKRYLEIAAQRHGFTLLRCEEFLTPNQARNLAVPYVQTKHLVFVDNDVLVSGGWLKALVDCAERTDAWVVGPLYFEFEPEGKRIHMFGGEIGIREDSRGEMDYVEKHTYAHTLLSDVGEELCSQRTELIEFHTVLIQMKVFEHIGLLDEGFMCNAEHGDLCLQVQQAGGEIWLEPAAQITYVPPKDLQGADRDFFLLRWSEAYGQASRRHLAEKYGIPRNSIGLKMRGRWQAEHRRFSIPWLLRWKRRLGTRMGSKFERKIVAPLEKMWNRWHFPPAQYNRVRQPHPSITQPTQNQQTQRAA